MLEKKGSVPVALCTHTFSYIKYFNKIHKICFQVTAFTISLVYVLIHEIVDFTNENTPFYYRHSFPI